jgi:excisionase family DNA binding protein
MEAQRRTLNVEDVTKILGVGRDFVRGLVRQGKLVNVGNNKRIRIPKESLERYLAGEGGTK